MNARARARRALRASMWWRMLRESGLPGERWGDAELAQVLNVPRAKVQRWIAKGWLKASRLRVSKGKGWYAIKRSAVRRAINDHREVAVAVLEAHLQSEEAVARESVRGRPRCPPLQRSTNHPSTTDQAPPGDPSKPG